MNKNFSLLLGILLALSSPIVIIAQTPTTIVASNYPPQDKAPPPVASWTALVDLTKVANSPVRTLGTPCDTADPFCYWPCFNCVRNDTDIATCPQKMDWGLSYDDGPSPFTQTVLSGLKAKNSKATFFVIGSRVVDHPDVLKQVHQDGHQIGVHTWSHTPLTTQSNEEIIAEIKWTEKVIKDTIGVTPLYMRPPAGDVDNRVRDIMKQLNYKIVMWDRDTFDWTSNLPNSTYDLNWIPGNFTQWVSQDQLGHVSLEHDLFVQTANKAPQVINIVSGANRNIKPIANCIGKTAFYLEDGNSTVATATGTGAGTVIPQSSDSNSKSVVTIITFGIIIINIFISFL